MATTTMAIVLSVVALFGAPSLSSQAVTASAPIERPIGVEAADDFRQLAHQVAEVRRDQLNYQIERDLLKEAYASNLDTVRLVLTMILGAFTILGYLGLRSIGRLRTDFQTELDQFRGAKSAVEKQLLAVEQAQGRADSQMQELATKNAEQDRRLRGLELREKAAKLSQEGNHALALEYVIVGLEVSPNDLAMLALKANCLSKLGRVTEAIGVHQQVLKAVPEDSSTIVNLLEAFLLTGRLKEYEELAKTHADVLAPRSPLLSWYLNALKLLVTKDRPGFLAHIDVLATLVQPEQAKKLNWEFQDARVSLAARRDLPGLGLFFVAMNVLEGREAISTLVARTAATRSPKSPPTQPSPTSTGA